MLQTWIWAAHMTHPILWHCRYTNILNGLVLLSLWSCHLHSRDHSHTPCVYTRQHGKMRRLTLFGGGDELRDSLGYSMTVLAWFIHGSESLCTIWPTPDGAGNQLTGMGFVKDGDFIRDPNYSTSAAQTTGDEVIPYSNIHDTTSLKLIVVPSIGSNTSMKSSRTPAGRRCVLDAVLAESGGGRSDRWSAGPP